MIVTSRGTSTMLSSVPKTDVNGLAVGRITSSTGTSWTLNFSIWTVSLAVVDAGPVEFVVDVEFVVGAVELI
jgi:hypothetical protein